jgi:hypothetical protein
VGRQLEIEDWEIGQDDFGGPLIFHLHAAAPVPAYVIGAEDDQRVAQCSDCMEILELSEAAVQSAR